MSHLAVRSEANWTIDRNEWLRTTEWEGRAVAKEVSQVQGVAGYRELDSTGGIRHSTQVIN